MWRTPRPRLLQLFRPLRPPPKAPTPTAHSRSISSAPLPKTWFDSKSPALSSTTPPDRPPDSPPGAQKSDHKLNDDRTITLGHTIRTLQSRLPTLLASPLPTEILSPSITLHLFPSTHPHLPVVRGRVAYIAALWTAPIAWGHLPGVGTRLRIESERMIGEKLRVRWKTAEGGREMAGIFIFEFDESGKVGRHVIENTEEGGEEGSEVGKVVTVTEWLMRKARGGEGDGGLVMGCKGGGR